MNFEATARSSCCLTHPVEYAFSIFLNHLKNCLSFRLHVASVSRSASLLGVLVPLSQNDSARFQRSSLLCPVAIAFWPSRNLGFLFQVVLVSALHSCLSVKSSSSKCSFMTFIQVFIQPSDSFLYHLGFINTLLVFSLRSLVLDNLVRKVSKELFRGSNVVAIAVASRECPA